jgi:hypothetical protein
MNTNNRIAEIKKRLKQGKYYVPYAPDDIEYLLSELSKTRLERNQLEANKNYYKEQLAQAKADGRLKILPAKPGDIIYRPEALQFCWVIANVEIYEDEIVFIDDSDNIFRPDDIGKTVFLTREEAEKVLEGGWK